MPNDPMLIPESVMVMPDSSSIEYCHSKVNLHEKGHGDIKSAEHTTTQPQSHT